MSKIVQVRFGSRLIRCIVLSNPVEISFGMAQYQYPPPYGYLFILRDQYRILSMTGIYNNKPTRVPFSLYVLFLNEKAEPIGDWFLMNPHSKDVPIPIGTYYMVEIPADIV